MTRALALLLLAGCMTSGAPSLAPAGGSTVAPATAVEAPACTCTAAPPRIVRAKDGGPTLLSASDLDAIARYVRACSEGR